MCLLATFAWIWYQCFASSVLMFFVLYIFVTKIWMPAFRMKNQLLEISPLIDKFS
uniref:Uncharacterized protein n=1 Tax=Arundo donax TaxID=35708 RepID=A0A0A9AI83_ARUDO